MKGSNLFTNAADQASTWMRKHAPKGNAEQAPTNDKERINKALKEVIGDQTEAVIKQCEIGEDSINITLLSPSFKSSMRFYEPQILKSLTFYLQKDLSAFHFNYANNTIKESVVAPPIRKTHTKRQSAKAANALSATASVTEDEELKAALIKLAQTIKPD